MKNQLPKIKLGIYRNYKGYDYEVVGIGTHTETREIYVVYKTLYETPGYDENALWVRPYDMFIGDVEIDGKVVSRFEYISPCHSERSRGISANQPTDLSTPALLRGRSVKMTNGSDGEVE